MGIERFPRQTEGRSTDIFSCFHKTQISDELSSGSQQELEHLSHWSQDSVHPFIGHSDSVNRDVVCQLPPEAGHPPYIATKWKKPAYGMNDFPERRWNVLDKALCSYGMIPRRADRCCYVLCSTQTCDPNWNKKCSTQRYGANDISLGSCVRTQGDAAFERMLDHNWRMPSYKHIRGRSHKPFCKCFLRNRWNRNFTTCLCQTQERFPCWFRRL